MGKTCCRRPGPKQKGSDADKTQGRRDRTAVPDLASSRLAGRVTLGSDRPMADQPGLTCFFYFERGRLRLHVKRLPDGRWARAQEGPQHPHLHRSASAPTPTLPYTLFQHAPWTITALSTALVTIPGTRPLHTHTHTHTHTRAQQVPDISAQPHFRHTRHHRQAYDDFAAA